MLRILLANGITSAAHGAIRISQHGIHAIESKALKKHDFPQNELSLDRDILHTEKQAPELGVEFANRQLATLRQIRASNVSVLEKLEVAKTKAKQRRNELVKRTKLIKTLLIVAQRATESNSFVALINDDIEKLGFSFPDLIEYEYVEEELVEM